ELQQPSVILVDQMGKVGSVNLYLAIKKTFPEKVVYHVHNLNTEIVAKIWDKINPTNEGVEGTTEDTKIDQSYVSYTYHTEPRRAVTASQSSGDRNYV
ncbi:MAG: hypothetical protein ACKPA9_16810, partial [Microcystis sp.]